MRLDRLREREPPDTGDDGLVTISIVSHGQRNLVDRLLADLARLGSQRIAKLILTLNLPEPLPSGIERLPFEVVVVRNDRARGFGANHNRAFRQCTTAWFAVLNPDLQIATDFISVALAACSPRDALLAPRVYDVTGAPADARRRLLTPWQLVFRVLGERTAAPDPETDWIAGMCIIARSRAFSAVGGFDERFFLYFEDADLCLRLQLAGWRIREVQEAGVVHAAQRASRHSLRHLRWHLASLAKHWTSGAFWRYLRVRHRLSRSVLVCAPTQDSPP